MTNSYGFIIVTTISGVTYSINPMQIKYIEHCEDETDEHDKVLIHFRDGEPLYVKMSAEVLRRMVYDAERRKLTNFSR